MVTELDRHVQQVAGVGFVPTPFGRSDALSDALGFADGGGVWVKDETGGVGGSQKARHLFTILLHLLAAERLGYLPQRPPLAIASCGNAALAAATLAAAATWPIDVYVPTWMSDGFGAELDRLGARVHRCERRSSDPAGDPAMFRFREAVEAGSIPFTVQGPENALALDGGRTMGWEIGHQLRVRVSSNSTGCSCRSAGALLRHASAPDCATRQAEFASSQCRRPDAPRCAGHGIAPVPISTTGPGNSVERWGELMTPWERPESFADGILDDETYDWLGVIDAIGGARADAPVVAAEADIVAAHQLARSAGFDVSPTGSAGLAGLARIDRHGPADRTGRCRDERAGTLTSDR